MSLGRLMASLQEAQGARPLAVRLRLSLWRVLRRPPPQHFGNFLPEFCGHWRLAAGLVRNSTDYYAPNTHQIRTKYARYVVTSESSLDSRQASSKTPLEAAPLGLVGSRWSSDDQAQIWRPIAAVHTTEFRQVPRCQHQVPVPVYWRYCPVWIHQWFELVFHLSHYLGRVRFWQFRA